MSFLRKKRGVFFLFQVGGCLIPSLFLCSVALGDTLTLKNGKSIKGLVVEQHADRIILSTEQGEIPILLSGIKNIDYDDPAQNFMKIGQAYEKANKYGEALAYYEKALEINPVLEEARKAAVGVRNHFWAASTEGPQNEMEKQQAIYDSWEQGRPMDELIHKKEAEDAKWLREGLGLTLERKGDWVRVETVDAKKEAASVGIKKNDRLVEIDNNSLRYLGPAVVRKNLLLPHLSNFTLEFERDCFLKKEKMKVSLDKLGFKLKLESQGLIIQSVKPGSIAALAGLKEGDFVTQVDAVPTRYMPLGKTIQLIQTSKADRAVITIRRAVFLTRR